MVTVKILADPGAVIDDTFKEAIRIAGILKTYV